MHTYINLLGSLPLLAWLSGAVHLASIAQAPDRFEHVHQVPPCLAPRTSPVSDRTCWLKTIRPHRRPCYGSTDTK
ncbi:hypothetical protein ASPCAL11462 [Aspergillus calidoustus]|uniref:Secreted protein n=1 Tax=Aspergillus calidoustus TaxID=454130 RepID=A0A0U5GAI5_ASPCI|nr:hypothetical protein ASPCAL11462 [Aspergillus calidoustus]